MDNNFDKLFKTKVEQHHFDYNPNEWESFLKKQASNSNKINKGFSSHWFIASLIVGVTAFSVIAYFVLTNTENNSKEVAIQKNVLPQKDVSNTDTNSSKATNKHSENSKVESNHIAVKPEVKKIHSKPIPIFNDKSDVKQTDNTTSNTSNSTSNQTLETNEITKTNETINSEPKLDQNNITTNSEVVVAPNVISETTSNKSNVEINSKTKQIQSNNPPISTHINKKENLTENATSPKVVNSELPVNNVSNANENQAPKTPKKYAYENYPVTVGEAKQKANFSLAQFKKTLENYLSISQIGLERSRDIATYLNNHFINDPSLSGFENRYTLSAICHVGAILQSIENSATPPFEYTIGNSFPIHSKNMGIGIAFNQIQSGSFNSIMLNLSMAYYATINRNSAVLIGGGINVKSVDRIEVPLLDYPWGSNSPQLLRDENQSTSLNIGVRVLHKSLYAGISATNLYWYAFTGNYHKSLSPLTLRLSCGGKLRLNQRWSFNPSLNYQFIPYLSNSYFVPYLSLSKMNKLYFGIHSENFKSIGAHIGYRAGNSLNLFFRSGLSLNKSLTDAYGRIHYGEVGIRIELGEYKK